MTPREKQLGRYFINTLLANFKAHLKDRVCARTLSDTHRGKIYSKQHLHLFFTDHYNLLSTLSSVLLLRSVVIVAESSLNSFILHMTKKHKSITESTVKKKNYYITVE